MPGRMQARTDKPLTRAEFAVGLRGASKAPKKKLSREEFARGLKGSVPEEPGFFQALGGHLLEGLGAVPGQGAKVGRDFARLQEEAQHDPNTLLGQMEPSVPQGESPMAAIAAGLQGAAQQVYPEESRGRGGLLEKVGGVTGDVLSLAPAMAAGPAASMLAFGAQNGLPLYYEIKAKTGDEEAAGWAMLFGNAIGQIGGSFGPAKYAGSVVRKLFTGELGQAVEKTVISHLLQGTAKGTVALTAQTGLNDLLRENLTGEDLDNWQRMKEQLPEALAVSGAFAGLDAYISVLKRPKAKKAPAKTTETTKTTEPAPVPQAAPEAPQQERLKELSGAEMLGPPAVEHGRRVFGTEGVPGALEERGRKERLQAIVGEVIGEGLPKPKKPVLAEEPIQEAGGAGFLGPEPAEEAVAAKEPSSVQQLYAGIPPIPGTEGAGKKVLGFVQSQLRSRGHTPEDARQFIESGKGVRDAEAREIRQRSRELQKAAKETYGKKWLETHGEALDAALKSPERLAALPEAVQTPLAAMRDHIDRLSRRMIETGAAGSPLAEQIIESHLGEYTTRVHRAYVDPSWKSKVPKDVKNRLFTLWNSWAQPISPEEAKALEQRAREKPPEAVTAMKQRRDLNKQIAVLERIPRGTPDGDYAQRKIKLLRQERRGLSRTAKRMTEAAQLARNEIRGRREFAGADEGDIRGTMSAILEAAREKTANPFAQIAVGKLGRKDLSILRRRKTFPKELREYLGEIKSPLASYAASVSKIAQVVSLHQAYNNIRDSGMGFWLFDKPTETHDAKISTEGNPALAPLDGLYTSPEIKKALMEVSPKETNLFVKGLMKLNAFIKWGKIVGAPHQIARQFWGNPIQSLRNGHGFALVSPKLIKKMYQSFGHLEEEKRLTRLGISGESIAGEEFKTLQQAQRNTPEELAAIRNSAWQGLIDVKDFAERNYQLPDEIQRRLGFYAEEQLRLEEGLSPAAAETAAAEFVRDHYPTWSRVAPILKNIRKTGFLGSYMAFKGEQYRNNGNLIATIYKEIHSENPKVKARGYKRIISTIAAYSIVPAAAKVWNGLNGVDDDEDKLRKEFLPPWDKDGQIVWKGDNLKGAYVKVSDTDPGSMFTNPIMGILQGKSPMDVLKDFARDQRNTFVGLAPATDLLVNIAAISALGTDLNGKAQDSLKDYVIEKIQPGAVQQIIRGVDRGYGSEIKAILSGSRSYDYDVVKSLGIETQLFSRRLSDNTRAMHRQGRGASSKAAEHLYKTAKDERRRLFQELSTKVKAANDLGYPRDKLEKLLNDTLSDEAADAVLRGGYLPYDEEAYQEKERKKAERL